jgi:hypothetical protein
LGGVGSNTWCRVRAEVLQCAYSMEPSGAVQLQFVRIAALDLWSSPVLAAARSRQQTEEEVLDFDI